MSMPARPWLPCDRTRDSTLLRVSDELKQAAAQIFRQAIEECDVGRAFLRSVQVEGLRLLVDGAVVAALDAVKRVRVVAVGKAAVPMLDALLATVPLAGCDVRGVLIAPQRPERVAQGFTFYAG